MYSYRTTCRFKWRMQRKKSKFVGHHDIHITRRTRTSWSSLMTLGQLPVSNHNHMTSNRTDSAFLHQCISFPYNHWKVKKPCQLHSWNGNTNSCYQGVGNTTEWIIYFPNGYPHAINNENVCTNSPMGQIHSNCYGGGGGQVSGLENIMYLQEQIPQSYNRLQLSNILYFLSSWSMKDWENMVIYDKN